MGRRQGPRVVQPIAHHEHLAALRREILHEGRLLGRKRPGDPVAQPDPLGKGLHRRLVARDKGTALPCARSPAMASSAPGRI